MLMACELYATVGYNHFKHQGYDPQIKKYKLSKEKNDFHYFIEIKIKKKVYCVDNYEIWTLREFLMRNNPPKIFKISDRKLRQLVDFFIAKKNKVDLAMYFFNLNQEDKYKDIESSTKLIISDIDNSIKFATRFD